ncbi:exopolysaccharide biosynthesis protein [Luteibacter aegosomaticola]|uniref:exopolysaccharide biosynthesis protein n=1 Tax=Luteibacter aegosomaticola TaxID=2911538 RepID=UPI001FF9E9AD|nr:exopolysaccharide biosynthesis protein [Luteibacter aegosomaticola]UPG91174.1 exopolysaccharide biosynthesis protein [Luteibacter aegosomaticola]
MTDKEPREEKTAALLRAAALSAPGERITVEQLLEPLKRRAFGFLLLLLAIPNFIPVPVGIGGIMGVLVVGLGLEMLIGLEQPWIPGFLKRRTMSRDGLLRFLDRIAPFSGRLEKACKPRLQRLTRRPFTFISGAVMILIGLLLALPIPFTNYLFGGMLVAFAFALVERDGALLLAVWASTLAAVALSATFSHALLKFFRDLV